MLPIRLLDTVVTEDVWLGLALYKGIFNVHNSMCVCVCVISVCVCVCVCVSSNVQATSSSAASYQRFLQDAGQAVVY